MYAQVILRGVFFAGSWLGIHHGTRRLRTPVTFSESTYCLLIGLKKCTNIFRSDWFGVQKVLRWLSSSASSLADTIIQLSHLRKSAFKRAENKLKGRLFLSWQQAVPQFYEVLRTSIGHWLR